MRSPTIIRQAVLSILAITANVVAGNGSAFGLDLKPSEIRGKSRKQQVSVLQHRFFEKSLRPEIGVLAGGFLNEAYTNTATRGARVGLFFSEWVGLEYQWSTTTITDSADRKALNDLKYYPVGDDGDAVPDTIVHPDPEINPVNKVQDATFVLAPFYGKMNLFDSMIVYSDLYLTAGGAKVETDQGPLNAVVVGGGQRFYLAQSLSLRIDARNRSYVEQRSGQESRKNAFSIDIGASYFFN
jgi:outer membrane beta-barrel protein